MPRVPNACSKTSRNCRTSRSQRSDNLLNVEELVARNKYPAQALPGLGGIGALLHRRRVSERLIDLRRFGLAADHREIRVFYAASVVGKLFHRPGGEA